MGFFTYNYFKNCNRPEVYLAYPDKRTIGALHTYELQTDLMANSPDKGSFIVYRYEDNVETRFYNEIEIGRYIHLYGVGWFRINEVSIVNEGINEYKEISILSIECELGQTYLTSFGSLGTDDDEQGGLDRYCLYNPLDVSHSIMHIVVQENPGWSIRYIDPQISTEYRSFNEDSVDTYSFLTGKVAETYECVFQFNSYERAISAYKLENLGKDTGITLNYRNVIKSIKMDSAEDDVKTVLTVVGGNDERTNTPLGIIDVHISGTNKIYDFSYFLHMMRPELQNGLKRYDELCKANESAYQEKMSSLLSHYDELGTLRNKLSDEGEDSTNWSTFGLVELKEKLSSYLDKMTALLDSEDGKRKEYNTARQQIEAEIIVREKQIADKELEINNILSQIQSLVVSLQDTLGAEFYAELNPYIREDTLTDDSFIATNSMTDREILEMQQSLLEHGRNELKKVCYPQFTLDVDLINFTLDYDYKRFTDALEMFNIIHINLEDRDSIISSRLLKLHINWDDPSDFKATFSNRNSLKETWILFDELKKQTEDASSKVEFSTGAWTSAASTSIDFDKYRNSILNASKQQITSNNNNEVMFGSYGIRCRKYLPEQNKYDPGQIWITNNIIGITQDDWNTVGIAIGYVKMNNDYFFGVCADTLVGRAILGNQLLISNTSGSYTIDKNGFIAKQGSYQVKINPDTPSDIFSISIDSKKLLYVDTQNKKLKFEGDIESISGHIASFLISGNSLTSGGVGMCSDTTGGAIALWAGNSNKNSAPFRLTNLGAVYCSNMTITGGSLAIGTKFSVKSDGSFNASDGKFSGEITALSGKIGDWSISNGVISGSYNSRITGGSIIGTMLRAGKTWGLNNQNYMLMADADTMSIGEFNVEEWNGRYVINSYDNTCGISPYPGNSYFYIWAGYHNKNNCDFFVRGDGLTYAKELLVGDSNTAAGWTVGRYLDWIYDEIQDIKNQLP